MELEDHLNSQVRSDTSRNFILHSPQRTSLHGANREDNETEDRSSKSKQSGEETSREQFIRVSSTENDGVIKYYVLTPAGLMVLIPTISNFGYPYGVLAKKHHELLPEIFALWSEFVKAGVEDIVSKKLERYCTMAFEEERRKLMVGKVRVEKRQLLDEFFLGPFPDDNLMVGGVRNRERWLKALLGDKKLCQAAIEACRSRVASFSNEAEGFSRLVEARGNEYATANFREGLRLLNTSLSEV